MDEGKRGSETLLSQGLDYSPSPPSRSPLLTTGTFHESFQSANGHSLPEFRQPQLLSGKRKISFEQNDMEDRSSPFVSKRFIKASRVRQAHSFCQPTSSANKPNSSELPVNGLGLNRSRLSLPAFATNRNVSWRITEPSKNLSKAIISDAVQTKEDEYPSPMIDDQARFMPAALSRAIYDSSTSSQSDVRARSSCKVSKCKVSKSLFVPAALQPRYSQSKGPSKSVTFSDLSAVVTSSTAKSLTSPDDTGLSLQLPLESGFGQSPPLGFSTDRSTSQQVEMEGDSEICKTILSVIWHKGLLGASIYSTDTMKLQLLQDIPEDRNFLSTCQLMMQTQPDIVLTGARLDSRFLETLRNLANGDEDDEHQKRLHLLLNEDLGYEACKNRLVLTFEQSLANGKADSEAFIKSTVNLNFINMVRASGALLRYLETNSVHLATRFDKEVSVLAVELYTMKSQVWMDASTFSGLRILHLADHPSTSLGNRYTREGFSLFGLMDRCKTSGGKLKLKEMFLRPSCDMRLLNERLDCLEYLAPSNASETSLLIKSHLGKLRNMSRIVCKMRNAELKSTDWLAMHRVLQSLIVITDVCVTHRKDLPLLSKFSDYRESMHSAGQILFDILDVELTRATKCFTVRPNYDAEMDALVQRQRDLPELLAERLTNHVKDIKRLVRSTVHIHYSSQLGCMLMVDITGKMERTGDYNVDGLKLEFLTESSAYYSSEFTREISEVHGDVNTDITDRGLALMYQLQNTLLPFMDSVLTVLDLCSELDCLIGLSSYCFEHNYVRPKLNNKDILCIKAGRHPLLDAQVDNFISNDTISGPGENNSRVMIITGPNASGKSIYLKQTLLIVYLAHIGCLVPAESADVFLTDSLLAHFPTSDSINSDVSTFTADLSRMAAIVTNATSKTLVVLDEFGKGTCPIDGTALLMAFLYRWISSEAKGCPHVLASSHFHTICKFNVIRNSPLVTLKTLETCTENSKLVYLYELVNGAAGSSHAAAVAQLLELPADCLTHGAQASDQFALARQAAKANRNSKHSQWKQEVVRQLLELDMSNEEITLQFLDNLNIEP